jgi:hypothetical protein
MFAHIRNMNHYGDDKDGGEEDTGKQDAVIKPPSNTSSAHDQEAAAVCQLNLLRNKS